MTFSVFSMLISTPSRVSGGTLRVRPRRYLAAVQYLPLVLAFVTALALAPATRQGLLDGGHVRENYRGEHIACPFGLLILAAAFIALAPIALAGRLIDDEAL